MKKFIVKVNDAKYSVKAKDSKEAISKVKKFRAKDSNKLQQLSYKLAQTANYFDRANSSSSRDILAKEDDVKQTEFYKLGLQTLTQLKIEAAAPKTANLDKDTFNMSTTLKLLDDAISTMRFMSDVKFKVLAEKLDAERTKYRKSILAANIKEAARQS